MTETSPLALAGGGTDEEVPYPVVRAVQKMVARTARLAAEHGLGAEADALTAAPSPGPDPSDRARVVVTGHLGAGSSSLVGALLGMPDLLPVDHHGRPHAPVLIRGGTPERAFARPSRDVAGAAGGDGELEPVRLDEVGTTASRRAGEAVIQVQLDQPGLAGLEILDAGPLSAGPSAAALAHGYATLGDAVVLTHDAKAPPGEQDRAVLSTLAAYAPRVYLVLTRTDASVDHEPVAAAARRMVATAPGLAGVTVLTTSSHLAARATGLRADGSPHADLVAELAGVEELARLLRQEVAGRHVAARLLAQAKACARVADKIAAASSSPEAPEASALTAELARLTALVAAEPTAKLGLQQAYQRMRSVSRSRLEGSIRQIRGQLREQLERSAAEDLDQFEDQVRAALAEAVVSVWQTQGELAAEAAALVARGFDGHDELGRVRLALTQADLVHAPSDTLEALGARSAMTLANQAAMNRQMQMRSALMMLPAMMTPARAAIGIVAGGAMLRGQSQARDAQLRIHLRTWLDQACADASRGLSTALEARALIAQHHLDERVVELAGQLRSRRAETEDRLSQHRPPPPDPGRAAVARLVRDTRILVSRVADRSSWPGRPTSPPEPPRDPNEPATRGARDVNQSSHQRGPGT